jgi:uncharacterized membrane protein
MNNLVKYFISGLVVLLPLSITAYFIVEAVSWLSTVLASSIYFIILPGVLIVITLIGFLTQSYFDRTGLSLFEKYISKIPLISLIYFSLKDITKALTGQNKKFSHPVAVKMSSIGIMKLGFITQQELNCFEDEEENERLVAVYFPHSYNFSGNLFLVPKENITPLNVNATNHMKYIVTGGIMDSR